MEIIEFNKKTRMTNWSMTELHSHEFYELYILTDGSRNLVFENNKVELSPNSLVVIPPFTPHLTEGGKHERINILFSPCFINEIYFQKPMITATGAYSIDNNSWTILNELLKTAIDIDNNSINLPDSHLTTIKTSFLNTILWFITNGKFTPIKLGHRFNKKNTDEQITQIIQYINENFAKKINIDDICEKFFFTKSNLYKRFEKFMSIPIGEYILFVKLNYAKKLLYTTKKPIDQVAYECGFSSQNYFSLIFKSKFSISPSYFRKLKY